MSIDLSQFHQVFFEESAEHLDTMEQQLVSIDLSNPTAEELNSIFRAAHSIKGGSGTFGFKDLADVTHILENQLDRIRHGKVQLTALMVDVFLKAIDVLRHMLETHRVGGEPEVASQQAICAELHALDGSSPTGAQPSTPAKTSAPSLVTQGLERRYRISIQSLEKHSFEVLEEQAPNYGTLLSAHFSPEASVVELNSSLAREELYEFLEFLSPPERISLEDISADLDGAPIAVEAEGYGLFMNSPGVPADSPDEPVPVEEGEGYGLYVDGPGSPVKSQSDTQETHVAYEEEGFGLFLPADGTPAKTPVLHEEEGFGLFAPIEPSPAPAAAVPAAQPKAAAPAAAASKQASAESSIRVSVEKVDQLIDLTGELVITQAMLAQTADTCGLTVSEEMQGALALLERNLRDLQEAVMSIRMLPMSFVFSRFPRMVRDTAGKLGKQVELKLIGEGTELDKGLIERVADPLTHLVRNSVDHGIELPDVRRANGKAEKGTITLSAAHQGGNVVISVTDDGQGLRRDKILAKAKEKNLPVHDGMSDNDVWLLIFAPGFSTADQVTDISGRGVGMDVVKRNVESMGGRIDISSTAGRGSSITIRLPLTLAILDGMSVAVGDEVYILPIGFIVESLQPKPEDIRTMAGKGRVLNVRNEYLPLVCLHEVFHVEPKYQRPQDALLIVVEADGVKITLQVDALLGQHQVVIKSLETNYRRVPGVSGATIMGDGRVALILDVAAIVRLSQS
ncbi:two-component system chemotaxis sensor kinase CheA [Chitinivorax tropicus]|uniref:Chemotaxis protein CheA n=1 Tax=Chitinivorax tropicus TaxID=714531 RepID=A0A840MW10_9PROT|nr:chemotaxis protein CheW [Chitinivorax tropicus]MBB5019361.1 two-component system chemotaxis sensor kinase CheA [Chitinivorax tropicus]